MPSLYERDFHAWTEAQVELLRAGRLVELDVDHLIEEIEDLGRRNRKELASYVEVVLLHLLKWRYQGRPPMAAEMPRSWWASIQNGRDAIREALEESPSLRRGLDKAIWTRYPRARRRAAAETGLPESRFPPDCPWTAGQILSPDFWPEKGTADDAPPSP